MQKIDTTTSRLALTAVAAALLTAFNAARADDVAATVERLSKPSSTLGVGIGYVTNDNQRFGQYTGLTKEGYYGALNASVIRRDDETGTWFRLLGYNLGMDAQELRVEHERQGNWRYFLDYSETPRILPYGVVTAVTGIGTNNQQVPTVSTAGRLVELKTERKATTFGVDKYLPGGFDVQVRLRNEEKDGSRLFGRGTTGAQEFLAEPVNSTTQILDASIAYTAERLQLVGGYSGSWYNNHNTALNVTGGNAALRAPAAPQPPFSPIALPPGNESHQLFLTGGYNFSATTRGTLKVAYTHATQDDAFINVSPGANISGRTNLGGVFDTTLVSGQVTSSPLPKLSLLASLRYEDRQDKTPIASYVSVTSGATSNGANEPRSVRMIAGKAEATYQLPQQFRLTGGVDIDQRKRNTSPVRVVSFRDETEETSYRAELRRSVSETANGSLALIHSNRNGSPFLTNVLFNSTSLYSNLVAPVTLADRERDKVRLTLDWVPLEALSLQFILDDARDSYSSRTDAGLGLRGGKAQFYSVDAAYAINDNWRTTAWISRSDTQTEQRQCAGPAPGNACTLPTATTFLLWSGDLRYLTDAYGVGLRGKPNGKLEVGADVQLGRDSAEHRQAALAGRGTLAGVGPLASLPDLHYRQTTLKLFAKYALQPNAGVRLDYVYDRFSTDEWRWANWVTTDGTRLVQQPVQKVGFVGVTGYYEWR